MISPDFVVIETRPLAFYFYAIGLTTYNLTLGTGVNSHLQEGLEIESYHIDSDFLLL